MIGLNQIIESPTLNQEGVASRRRRTPSQYAQSIRQLSKINNRWEQRIKYAPSKEDSSLQYSRQKMQKNPALTCILPGKITALKLHVIIKKQPKNKHAKCLKLQKPVVKEQQKNENLVDVLFKLCEQQKWNEEPKINEGTMTSVNQLNQSREYCFKERKSRRGKQEKQKYIQMYEKYQALQQKLEEIEHYAFFL